MPRMILASSSLAAPVTLRSSQLFAFIVGPRSARARACDERKRNQKGWSPTQLGPDKLCPVAAHLASWHRGRAEVRRAQHERFPATSPSTPPSLPTWRAGARGSSHPPPFLFWQDRERTGDVGTGLLETNRGTTAYVQVRCTPPRTAIDPTPQARWPRPCRRRPSWRWPVRTNGQPRVSHLDRNR